MEAISNYFRKKLTMFRHFREHTKQQQLRCRCCQAPYLAAVKLLPQSVCQMEVAKFLFPRFLCLTLHLPVMSMGVLS